MAGPTLLLGSILGGSSPTAAPLVQAVTELKSLRELGLSLPAWQPMLKTFAGQLTRLMVRHISSHAEVKLLRTILWFVRTTRATLQLQGFDLIHDSVALCTVCRSAMRPLWGDSSGALRLQAHKFASAFWHLKAARTLELSSDTDLATDSKDAFQVQGTDHGIRHIVPVRQARPWTSCNSS
jgi:hypothetical protein